MHLKSTVRAFIWGGGCPAASVRLTREYSEADHLFSPI